ncbi:MAG: hypothetical protein ACYTXA_06870 [Nostoc sp.]
MRHRAWAKQVTSSPYPILLYDRLRQRQRYFDPSLGEPSLRDAARTAKLRATRRSVQVSTTAPFPMPKNSIPTVGEVFYSVEVPNYVDFLRSYV